LKTNLLFLLTIVFSLTSLTCDAKDTTKVPEQKVMHILKDTALYITFPYHLIVLEDGSTWRTGYSEPNFPSEGDVIKSDDGCFFINTTDCESYTLDYIGLFNPTPLDIEHTISFYPMDLEIDFDERYLQNHQQNGGDSSEWAGWQRALKFLYTSNQGIYFDSYGKNFKDWGTCESIYTINPCETAEEEYLACPAKNEFRQVKSLPLIHKSTKLLDVNLESRIFLVEGEERPWNTVLSFCEIINTWDPSHKICVTEFPTSVQLTEGDKKPYYSSHERNLLHFFLRQQHGLDLDWTTLSNWNLRVGLAMNLDTEEAVLIWDLIPPELQ